MTPRSETEWRMWRLHRHRRLDALGDWFESAALDQATQDDYRAQIAWLHAAVDAVGPDTDTDTERCGP